MELLIPSLVISFVATALLGCAAEEIPSFLHVCRRTDPELDKCLMKTVEEIRPHLVTGVPEYNIPSVEPLIIKDLVKENTSGLSLTTSDVVAYGGGNFKVNSFHVDLDTMKFTTDVDIPELKIEAKYTVNGRVMVLHIHGGGNFYGNITNCKTHGVFQAEIYERDGEEYLRFVSSSMAVDVGSGQIKVETGLEKVLNDIVNDVLNKNLHGFLKELMPVIEKGLAAEFLDIAGKIVKPFTVDQLFPK